MFREEDLRELSNVSSRHFPDRSAKWLIRQREHLQALVEMLAGEIADALDFGRVEQLHRSFISDELRTQESDMIFSVPFRDPTGRCEEVIIYILIEHQSSVDPSMELRLLSYMTQIWMEERRRFSRAPGLAHTGYRGVYARHLVSLPPHPAPQKSRRTSRLTSYAH